MIVRVKDGNEIKTLDVALTRYVDAAVATMGSDVNIVQVDGTDPVIAGATNTMYVCGEVATLNFTPPSTGSVMVMFTSGDTPTTLTLPATVKMPEWFVIEANRIYEISVVGGVYGAVMSWQA